MKKLLLKIARMPWMGTLIGRCITRLAHWLPLRIVTENADCIAFRHPAPSYSTHLLVMLKAQARDVACITGEQLACIAATAAAAIDKLGLNAPHILLWTNGGRFQEVRQLHFHLFPSELDREADMHAVRTFSVGGTVVRECVRGNSAVSNLLILDASAGEFCAAFAQIANEYRLEFRGYSVFLDLSRQAGRENRFYIRMG